MHTPFPLNLSSFSFFSFLFLSLYSSVRIFLTKQAHIGTYSVLCFFPLPCCFFLPYFLFIYLLHTYTHSRSLLPPSPSVSLCSWGSFLPRHMRDNHIWYIIITSITLISLLTVTTPITLIMISLNSALTHTFPFSCGWN